MIEWLLAAVLCASLVAAAGALLAYAAARRGRSEALGRLDAVELLRREGDAIRAANEQEVRALRQELSATLSQFQAGTTQSVGLLSGEILNQIKMFGERLEASNKTVEERVAGIGGKLNTDIAQMGESATRNRDALRNVIEQRLDASVAAHAEAARSLREELDGSFQRMRQAVGETLRQMHEQQHERLEATKGALEALAARQAESGEQLRATVEGRLDLLRNENAAELEKVRATVDEKLNATLNKRLDESFGRVVDQLTLVSKGIGEMQALASNVGDLKTVLTNPKVRGTFGEVQLALLIEDFLTPEQYIRNAQIKEGSGERVEYAIRLRTNADGEEVLIPVDAKFPREDYDRLIAAMHDGDTMLAAKFRKDLETRLKQFARAIRDKYIDAPRTTDFGILFLPTEGLYAEALREPALFDFVRRECGVVLAGPTTFSAILSAFQMNFRSAALAKQSSEVWKVLSAVRTEFGRYNKVVTSLGNQLRTAATSVDKLGVRARAMDRKLRDVELLPGDGDAQRLLGLTEESLAPTGEEDEDALEAVEALEVQSAIVVAARAGK
jgi:DNA recombination protein RmuC